MFNVTTGAFAQLERRFLSDIRHLQDKNPLSNFLILSPSSRLLTHLQYQLASENAGLLNSHFLTFFALAERLLSENVYTETVVTEPALYEEMIRQTLSGDAPETVDVAIRRALHIEGKIVPRGLAGALAATMKDLRDAGMRADKAIQAAQEGYLGAEAPEAAATLALYARLIGLFEKQDLRSSADLLRRAAQEAPAHPWLKQQKAIFLYGFYDLTGVQLDLILSLAQHPNATIYFPYEEGNPAFAYAEKLLRDPAFLSKVGKQTSLAETARSLPRPVSHLWSCSGARDEVWTTAKEILKLADEGMAYHEMCVMSRHLSPYVSPLREIFSAHQIPYVSSKQEPAGSHPLVKTIRTLLNFDVTHPRAKTTQIELEKSPYVVTTQGDAAPTLATWTSHCRWAKDRIAHSIRLPSDASREESLLLATVLSTLDDLTVLNRLARTVARRHFLDTWQDKVDAIERPVTEKPHAGVQVLEVQQARGLLFRTVFLLGMNEKVFPRLIREDPFLSDAARAALAQATGCRLGKKLSGYDEERLLFDLMGRTATHHWHLLTQRSDEDGKARIPSVYLNDIERENPGLEPVRVPRSNAEKFDKRAPLTWTPKELSFLVNRAQQDPRPLYQALSWDQASYDRLSATQALLESFRTGLGPFDGVLTDPSLVANTLKKAFSPSSLEELAECPFQYYASHVLHIPVEEDLAPEGEMTPQALGQLFHKTLELFYTSCKEQGFPTDDVQIDRRLREAADLCFQSFSGRLSTVYPLALRATKDLVIKELLLFLKSDFEEFNASGFRPFWFEQPMSGLLGQGALPYLFHGKPDRLDTRETNGITDVRVVDYKSGKPKPWSGRIETQLIQGRFLQLPIYLGLAGAFAEKTLGRKAAATSATLRPVREPDGEAVPKTLTTDFWQTPSASLFIDNIKELIGLIEKERFYIEPSTGEWGYCTRCNFATICRKEHMPSRIRAERDPIRQQVVEKMSRTAPAAEKKQRSDALDQV